MATEWQHGPTTKRADGQPAEKASRRKEVAFGKNAVAARSGGRRGAAGVMDSRHLGGSGRATGVSPVAVGRGVPPNRDGRVALLRDRLFRGGLLRLWFGLGVLPAVLLTGFGLARALLAVFGRRYNPRAGITLQTPINNIPSCVKQHIDKCWSVYGAPMNAQTPWTRHYCTCVNGVCPRCSAYQV